MNTPAERKFLSVADLDWSDLKFLVEVGDAGSLREAARRQRVSVNTVRAHLAKLEQVAGEAVVNRGLSGAKLTKTGERLYHAAAALGRTPIDGADARDKGLIEPGTFTFGCTEGVGTSWLTPRVAALSNQIRPCCNSTSCRVIALSILAWHIGRQLMPTSLLRRWRRST